MLSEEITEKSFFIGSIMNDSNIERLSRLVFSGLMSYHADYFSLIQDCLNLSNFTLLSKIFLKENPTHVFLQNYHPLNSYIANLCKKNDTTFLYYVHEPYTTDKRAHGLLQQYALYAYEYLQGKLLEKTDVAIVPSNESERSFHKRYPDFSGRTMVVPLMYEDLGKHPNHTLCDRSYITFVGPPGPAKNPDKFLEIVEYASRRKLGCEFCLISRLEVREPKYYGKPNLRIFYKKKITDEEFGRFIQRSIAVITPYKRETQSSVVLISYMYGTPVISSTAGGLPKFVHHKKTGYLLDVNAKAEEWIEGIRYVTENFSVLSRNCRKYFVENFSGKNWKKYLDALMA
jgi:glycosyltransferase involved in cell wall biosynthesis